MREFEFFHHLKALPGTWIILRMDGRAFHTFTSKLQKPFDKDFHFIMKHTVYFLMCQFNAVYGYTESDEISIVLPPTTQIFGREVEKLVSLSASMTSAYFNLQLADVLPDVKIDRQKMAPVFDSRMWMAPTMQDVIDYFRWRQSDATRCCLNGAVFWNLVYRGISRSKATSFCSGKNQSDLQEYLHQQGVNFNDLPTWQKHGTGFYWTVREMPVELPPAALQRLFKSGKPIPRRSLFAEG